MKSYVYRRELTRKELLPAIGMGAGLGVGVAVVTAYIAQIFLRRTPIDAARQDRLASGGSAGVPGHIGTAPHAPPRR